MAPIDPRILRGVQVVVSSPAVERVAVLMTPTKVIGGDSIESANRGGDVTAGLTAAVEWISAHLPVYSVNLVLTTATDLWALQYPAANELWMLEREDGGAGFSHCLDARTDRIHARSEALADHPNVIVASEPMDDDPGWRLLDSGELLHSAPDLAVVTSVPFPDQPTHQLSMSDLAAAAATSQQKTRNGRT